MFYVENIGEVVSQVYEVEGVTTWEQAKNKSWDMMSEGDYLVECEPDAVEESIEGYYMIDKDKCINCTKLERGVWLPHDIDFNDNIYYFDDDTETLYDLHGKELEQWFFDNGIQVIEGVSDFDLHCFYVFNGSKFLGTIYLKNNGEVEQCRKSLDDGEDPISGKWNDECGHVCTLDGWNEEN